MKAQYARGLTVKPSKIDGLGCYAARRFPKGRKIAEYTGEKISRREIQRRLAGARHVRICRLNADWAIDGGVGGNGTQYLNHACAPNCYFRILHGHIIIFALRDIAPGEELQLDYEDSWDEFDCKCGASKCRGKVNK